MSYGATGSASTITELTGNMHVNVADPHAALADPQFRTAVAAGIAPPPWGVLPSSGAVRK